MSPVILQLVLGCTILGIIVCGPSVLILKRISKVLSYRQATWIIAASYLISLALIFAAYLVAMYFGIGNNLIGIAWLFIFGYSITKLSEKNYGIPNAKFPAVGARVAFWFLVMTWGVIGIVWLIYYAASRL